MDTCELRELCIENGWFTCGTNRQYEKMFDYNDEIHTVECGHEYPTLTEIHTLAYLIWICSDTKYSQADIVEKLIEAECRRK